MYQEIDYYEVLGVSRDASTVEIRRAYKKLALENHPDKVPEPERFEAEQKFKEISEAYETLADPQQRSHYDLYGKNSSSGNNFSNWQDYYDPGFGPEAFSDFFGFNDFSSNTKSGPGAYRSGKRTDNAEIEIEISLEDAFKGKVVKMGSSRRVLCKTCHGIGAKPKAKPKVCSKCGGRGSIEKIKPLNHGMMTINRVPCDTCQGKGTIFRSKDLCKRCSGSGTTEEKSVLEVVIPKGVVSGHQVLFKGLADEQYQKETGDIIITIRVQEHSSFTRMGQDLYAKASISLKESLTGFSRVLVTHLDNRGLKVSVPRGSITKPGTYIKVRNEGMPGGDLFIEVEVRFPDSIDPSIADGLQSILPSESPIPPPPNREIDDVCHVFVNHEDLPEYKHGSTNASDDTFNPNGCPTM